MRNSTRQQLETQGDSEQHPGGCSSLTGGAIACACTENRAGGQVGLVGERRSDPSCYLPICRNSDIATFDNDDLPT